MDERTPLRTFGDALRHRAWLVLAVVVVFLLGGLALVRFVPPTYTAQATLLVDNRWNGTQDLDTALLSSEHLALLFLQESTSRPVLQNVISTLGLRVTPDQLTKRINAQVIKGTSLIAITASADRPQDASAIANAIAQTVVEQNRQEVADRLQATRKYLASELSNLSQQIDTLQKTSPPANNSTAIAARQAQLAGLQSQYDSTYAKMQDITISQTRGESSVAVSDSATLPTRPTSPDPLRWLLAALLGGICMGVVLALVAEHYDDRLNSAEGLARASGTSLVTMVPRQFGRSRDQQSNPYVLAHANLAVRHPEAHRVMFTPASSSDRADTLALQFGWAAAHAGQRVVVVQADAPAHALPSPVSPNGTSMTTIPLAAPSDPRLVARAFGHGDGQYDLAVLSVLALDASPTAISMAPAADLAIIVATAGMTHAADVRRTADSLRQAGVEVAASMLVAKGGAAAWNGAEGTH